jgi:hypothetical protein
MLGTEPSKQHRQVDADVDHELGRQALAPEQRCQRQHLHDGDERLHQPRARRLVKRQ